VLPGRFDGLSHINVGKTDKPHQAAAMNIARSRLVLSEGLAVGTHTIFDGRLLEAP